MTKKIVEAYQYFDNNIMLVFLEKFDMSLDELIYRNFHNLTMQEKESIFMQIIICIATFHSLVNMVHDDISYKNFFVKYIDYNESIPYYMHYTLYGKDIYIPFCGFIVVLADYGNVKAPDLKGIINDYDIIFEPTFNAFYNIQKDIDIDKYQQIPSEYALLMFLKDKMFKYQNIDAKHIVNNNTVYRIF
jgi:hypothetical protein